MGARRASVLLVVVSALGVAAALWLGLRPDSRAGTRCGPIVTQGNRRLAACDGYYSGRYVQVGVALGIAAIAYVASVVVERVAERRLHRDA